VHHLVDDDHVSRALEDLHEIVVGPRHHRWTRVESHDAAFGQRQILRSVATLARVISRFLDRLRLGRQWWNSAIGRIDDQRRYASVHPPVVHEFAKTETRDHNLNVLRDLRDLFVIFVAGSS
jgi:hypothetical protein